MMSVHSTSPKSSHLFLPGSRNGVQGSHLGISGNSNQASKMSMYSDTEHIVEGNHSPRIQHTTPEADNQPRGIYSQRPSIYTFNYRRRSTLTFGDRRNQPGGAE